MRRRLNSERLHASISRPAMPWGSSAPRNWECSPLSTGAAVGPPSPAPLRATKEKGGVGSGQAWADLFPDGKQQGAQPRGHDHGHALSLWKFVPGGCREGTAEPLKPHTIILYLQEFGSQASRLSPGSPEHTCLPSSAPSLPCKAKNRIWLYQGNSGLLLS